MNLKVERVKKGISQTELQRLSSVSRATISHIEGGYIPSVKVAKKLAEALQIDWHNFYNNTEGDDE